MFKLILLFSLILGVFSNQKGFDDYFNSVSWITRDGVLSLSIDHKTIQFSQLADSFKEIELRFSQDPEWRNRDSLYAQYYCHAQFASYKNPWNIEPHRTETNWLQLVLTGCNPRIFYENLRKLIQ